MTAPKLTKAMQVVLADLYDVSIKEGGAITLKNRFHPSAYALGKLGFVKQIDRFPYRPVYIITKAGAEYQKQATK